MVWKSGRARWGMAGLILVTLIFMAAIRPATGNTPFVVTNMRADPRLSVMTYNVEGLPWPLRVGRSAAFEKIGARLAALRMSGEQPHIIALQEAFSYDAKRIGFRGGYRYIASGPTADMAGAQATRPGDIAFQAASEFLHGERSGKLLDSGLQILSDYPILSVKRLAFPRYACAGYDCLANKGAVIAIVEVPGMPGPMAVVDVHLNSRTASGVAPKRSLYAYKRQIDALDAFLQSSIAPGMPVIVAGDFNVGPQPTRLSYFAAHFRRWTSSPASGPTSGPKSGPKSGIVTDALHSCFAKTSSCGEALPADAGYSLQQARDWQLSIPGAAYRLGARALAVPFGHEVDGSMLSDHVGYTAYYDVIHAAGDR